MAQITVLPGIVQQFDIPEAVDVSSFATSADLSALQQTVADNRQFQIDDDEVIERQISQLTSRIEVLESQMGAAAPAEAFAALVQRNNEFEKQLIELAPGKYPVYLELTTIASLPSNANRANRYTINGRVVSSEKIEPVTVYIGTDTNPVSGPTWSGMTNQDCTFTTEEFMVPWGQVMFWAVTVNGQHYSAPFYYSFNVLA